MIYEFGKIGRHHKEENKPSQDYTCHSEDKNYICIVLADGISSCSKSGEGAKITAEAMRKILFEKASSFMDAEDDDIKNSILPHVIYELRKFSESEGEDFIEYSSTVAAILYEKATERYIGISVGDSLILASGFGRTKVIGMPDDSTNGCMSVTTADVIKKTGIIRGNGNYEMFMILSDGAWREMFTRGKMNSDIQKILTDCNIDNLEKYLVDKDPFDDHSFVAAEIN